MCIRDSVNAERLLFLSLFVYHGAALVHHQEAVPIFHCKMCIRDRNTTTAQPAETTAKAVAENEASQSADSTAEGGTAESRTESSAGSAAYTIGVGQFAEHGSLAVSYTHLDVYKRQLYCRPAA